MKHETELLLLSLDGLIDQAHREPEKAEQCVSMIAAVIARVRRRTCAHCYRPIRKAHKWKRVEGGIAHRQCDNPDSYIEEDEYVRRYGHHSYGWERRHENIGTPYPSWNELAKQRIEAVKQE